MSGNSVQLLAKSGDPPVSLEEHTEDVELAMAMIREIWPDLPASLETAARFHDFGKAARGFQDMLRGLGPSWGFRHEVLSAAIFKRCFTLTDPDWQRAYLSVLTHHKNLLDADKRVCESLRHCQSIGPNATWNTKWNELDETALTASFGPDLVNWTFDPETDSPANDVFALADDICPVFNDLRTALCRGALVAADHIASAKLGMAITGENITGSNLLRYMQSLEPVTWQSWNGIQEVCGATSGNAMLIAPTGSGKTEAAVLWMLRNRSRYERVFYILPYQVSINATAERLSEVFPDDGGEALLYRNSTVSAMHSNTALAYLQSAMSAGLDQNQALRIGIMASEAVRKIYSPIKVTTVYQLLDIFFGRKFFEVGLLELYNSVVIFDEIHAYDGHTMGLVLVLLECLNKIGAKVFIMTATLPETLRERLQIAAHIPHDSVVSPAPNDDMVQEVRRKVYLRDAPIEELVLGSRSDIEAALRSGKRVVIVCNTVGKALDLHYDLKDLNPMLVHSRFTFGDRSERETKRNLSRRPFIISTQIIEVSLDVSFDLMFTELAPIDDLLQRFGRVNRHGVPNPNNLGICHISLAIEAGSITIYGGDLLAATSSVLSQDLVQPEANPAETLPLDYARACDWIQRVYADGLPISQHEAMIAAQLAFKDCVEQLKPMHDAPAVDLEKNLFRSVQVVPAKFAVEWCEYKKQRRHLEAKRLIVSVNESVWKGVRSEHGIAASHSVWVGTGQRRREQIVALFEYDSDAAGSFDGTGLRLDRPPIPNPMTLGAILTDDDDD